MTKRFCRDCGRELVERVERGGFDPKTGERLRTVWLECPRFGRSWRNLWMGGAAHKSVARDRPLMARTWM